MPGDIYLHGKEMKKMKKSFCQCLTGQENLCIIMTCE